MTRRLSDLSDNLPLVETAWWGELYWINRGSSGEERFSPLGYEVRKFTDQAVLRAYAELLEAAFIWAHADAFAWNVLVIDAPHEVGEDFVMIKRQAGVLLRNFYPEHTDDVVEAPGDQIRLLSETVSRMQLEAESGTDKVLSSMVASRLARLDRHIVYDDTEQRFHLWDLDPNTAELDTWRGVSERNVDRRE